MALAVVGGRSIVWTCEPFIVDCLVALWHESNDRLNSNRVEDLLEPGNRDSLVVVFFVAAYHLLAHAEPSGQISLRHALCDTDFRNERRDLIKPLDPWKNQATRFQLVVFPEFVFEMANHALVTRPHRRRTLACCVWLHSWQCSPESGELGGRPLSLGFALDHVHATKPSH